MITRNASCKPDYTLSGADWPRHWARCFCSPTNSSPSGRWTLPTIDRICAVPCHRVIASDGNLKGYAWGLHRRRWLLEHEGAISAPGLAAPLPQSGTLPAF